MTEDDGYETVVPDLNVTPSDELLLAKMDYMIGFPRVFHEEDFKRVVADHRQAAYNQALKDAAEVVKGGIPAGGGRYVPKGYAFIFGRWLVEPEHIATTILSLGDKSNG